MNRHVLLCALALAAAASAKPMMAKDVPIDRLIDNTRAAIKTNPKDAENHYVLGRLLTMKYCGQTSFLLYGGDESSVPSIHGAMTENADPKAPADAKLLDAALKELEAAKQLDGKLTKANADHDGVSEPVEVHDLDAFGIVAINATAEGRREGVPWSSRGVTLADGSTRATFDWTPTSSPEPHAAR